MIRLHSATVGSSCGPHPDALERLRLSPSRVTAPQTPRTHRLDFGGHRYRSCALVDTRSSAWRRRRSSISSCNATGSPSFCLFGGLYVITTPSPSFLRLSGNDRTMVTMTFFGSEQLNSDACRVDLSAQTQKALIVEMSPAPGRIVWGSFPTRTKQALVRSTI
jgi:hypothetical protein